MTTTLQLLLEYRAHRRSRATDDSATQMALRRAATKLTKGKYIEAKSVVGHVLAMPHGQTSMDERAMAYLLMGITQEAEGDLAAAAASHRAGIEWGAHGDEQLVAANKALLGHVLFLSGDIVGATSAYASAIERAERPHCRALLADHLRWAYAQSPSPSTDIPIEPSAPTTQSHPADISSPGERVSASLDAAQEALDRGDPQRAVEWCRSLANLLTGPQPATVRSRHRDIMSEALHRLGQTDVAIEFLTQQMIDEPAIPLRVSNHLKLAELQNHLGNIDQSWEHIRAFREGSAGSTVGLADLLKLVRVLARLSESEEEHQAELRMNEEYKARNRELAHLSTSLERSLRGPLTTLKFGVDTAEQRPEAMASMQTQVDVAIGRMERSTAQLALLGLLDAGRVAASDSFDLPSAVRAAVSDLDPTAAVKEVSIVFADVDRELRCRGDKQVAVEAVKGVLGSAIAVAGRRTPVGVEVGYGLSRAWLDITFPGLDPGSESALDPFALLPDLPWVPTAGESDGDIGLHLAARISELFGGQATVQPASSEVSVVRLGFVRVDRAGSDGV